MDRRPKLMPQQQKEAQRRAEGATLKERTRSYNVCAHDRARGLYLGTGLVEDHRELYLADRVGLLIDDP
jgi:hypothetical protein